MKKILMGFLLFFGIFFYLRSRSRNESIDYQFDGVVDSIVYDIKGYPEVRIDGKKYFLSGTSVNWHFNQEIQKNDSLIKKKNTLIIKLIKHNTGKVLVFGN